MSGESILTSNALPKIKKKKTSFGERILISAEKHRWATAFSISATILWTATACEQLISELFEEPTDIKYASYIYGGIFFISTSVVLYSALLQDRNTTFSSKAAIFCAYFAAYIATDSLRMAIIEELDSVILNQLIGIAMVFIPYAFTKGILTIIDSFAPKTVTYLIISAGEDLNPETRVADAATRSVYNTYCAEESRYDIYVNPDANTQVNVNSNLSSLYNTGENIYPVAAPPYPEYQTTTGYCNWRDDGVYYGDENCRVENLPNNLYNGRYYNPADDINSCGNYCGH